MRFSINEKNSLFSCIGAFVVLFLVSFECGKLLAIHKWGNETTAEVKILNYDCSNRMPIKKQAPTLVLEYLAFGQVRNHKTEWWVSGEHGYCNLSLGNELKISSIAIRFGESLLVLSASQYELETSDDRKVVLWIALFFFLFLLVVHIALSRQAKKNQALKSRGQRP